MALAKSLFSSLFIVIFCLLGNHVQAASIPDPIGDIYVQDFAHVLTEQQKKELIDLGMYLDDHTGAQIAVLTVDSLQGLQVDEYALKAFREYKLGNADKDNGVLLLLALNDRKIRIEVGYGLEGILPDGKVGRILDSYSLPYLEEGNIGLAVTNTYKQLFNEVSSEYQLNKQTKAIAHEYAAQGEGPSLLSIIIFSFIALAIIFLDFRFLGGAFTLTILRILASFTRGGGRGGGGGFRGGGGGSTGGGGASRGW